MLSPEDEARAVTDVALRLAVSFPAVGSEVVQGAVRTSHEQFAGSPIRDFVPVLVERMAMARLRGGGDLTPTPAR